MAYRVQYVLLILAVLAGLQLYYVQGEYWPAWNFFVQEEKLEVPTKVADHVQTHLKPVRESKGTSGVPTSFDSLTEPAQLISHSSDFDNDLRSFHRKLMALKDHDDLIRILHFGDSQIEGDRVSGIIRSFFQERFGGEGIGYIPVAENHVSRLNVKRRVSGWEGYRIFGGATPSPHNSFGFEGYFHRPKTGAQESEILLSPAVNYYAKADQFSELKVMYRTNAEGMIFHLLLDGQQVQGKVQELGKVKQITFELKDYHGGELKLFCKSDQEVDVYAVGLDGKKGVAVDNVAMGGSSGIEFSKMNEELLREQFQMMNVGLIIYQFGINVIPYIVEDYTFYEQLIYKQLKLFKRICPGVSILVVGVSDMAMKEGELYTSYPNIGAIKEAQKRAAKRAGCAFWDLQEVMGGENAMREWVYAKPPLAEKDFTHFNRKGAKKIGKRLAEALYFDFMQFQRSPD